MLVTEMFHLVLALVNFTISLRRQTAAGKQREERLASELRWF